ncbi:hypothetical protein [Endozoicomonas sp. ALC066]|uniref:hypothetical protein n=1 Tax=Endozoicomonas sp. ALC066 TaxID=3403078 RepID=UPI003BB7B5A5
MMVKGVNPEAINELLNRFGYYEVLNCTSFTSYQLLELLDMSIEGKPLLGANIEENEDEAGNLYRSTFREEPDGQHYTGQQKVVEAGPL